MASRRNKLHGLVFLPRNPTRLERDSLRRLGLDLLTPVGRRVFWATVAATSDSTAFPVRPLFYAKVGARERVAPEVWKGDVGKYFIELPGGKTVHYVINADSSLNAVVEFHRDVTAGDAENILRAHALVFRKLSDVIWTVTAPPTALRSLAEADAVKWIDLPAPPIVPENNVTRQAIHVDEVQNVDPATGHVNGLGGKGITVGVFDLGVDETHTDFGSRVIVNDMGAYWHGTHVAGVIAGDGTASTGSDSWGNANATAGTAAFQWRGMAPEAKLIDADANQSVIAATVAKYEAVNAMDISNHSYPYSFDGEYNAWDEIHDQMIRGDATSAGLPIPPREQVYSSGNSGTNPIPAGHEQVGYFSLSKQSKNGIIVGNYDPATGKIDQTSSLGPAHDGRIKPDVVAPGANVKSTAFCKKGGSDVDPFSVCVSPPSSLITTRSSFYQYIKGSSESAAAVTGMLALVLQKFESLYGRTSDGLPILPSTLRALTIHSAHDIAGPVWFSNADGPVQAFAGPDFVTGYGLVDAQQAVSVIADGRFLEDFVTDECDTRSWWIRVNGDAELRMTLAWDDLPGSTSDPFTKPRLINDLDLEVIGPDAAIHYPWLLDQKAKDAAGLDVSDAAQTCTSELTIERKVLPTSTPNYVAVGDPHNVNDPLTGGVLQPATTGKDHLNNAEQVVVTAPTNGWWKIRVVAFKMPIGSQTFSVVMSRAPQLYIPIVHPSVFCWGSASCPRIFYDLRICERVPTICSPIYIKHGYLPLKFTAASQAAFVPLDRICIFALKCPQCVRDGLCRQLSITVDRLPRDFSLVLFDLTGRRVALDTSSGTRKQLSLGMTRTAGYTLAIRAGSSMRRFRPYDFPVHITGLP